MWWGRTSYERETNACTYGGMRSITPSRQRGAPPVPHQPQSRKRRGRPLSHCMLNDLQQRRADDDEDEEPEHDGSH
eukprot:CAMPEP_0174722330 /NCGR_PEP_ID=MMETSP1094-20130205/38222_1 /TAXON_ID=156173 /ORGANISM="Chrysochromulina brevifilum, Strain UTEX LB 985" /LENGTH=75 /DNA_ID=CAMNT_0015923163 /DNA_START=258 /DNA_END=485 /DNA_ORIENTATION=+